MKRKEVLGPLLLITAGTMLLLQNLNLFDNVFSKGWPIFLIIIGISKIFENKK